MSERMCSYSHGRVEKFSPQYCNNYIIHPIIHTTLQTRFTVYSVCQGLILVGINLQMLNILRGHASYTCHHHGSYTHHDHGSYTRYSIRMCDWTRDLRIIPVQSDFYCQATQFSDNSRTNRIVGDMFYRALHF